MTTTEQRPAFLVEDARDADALDLAQAAYDEGWTRGHAAGLTARPPAEALVPVPVSWRHATPGDVFRAPSGALWHIGHVAPRPDGRIAVHAASGPTVHNGDVDPDDTVHLLYPVAEVDAITLCVEQLGARLIAGRTVT